MITLSDVQDRTFHNFFMYLKLFNVPFMMLSRTNWLKFVIFLRFEHNPKISQQKTQVNMSSSCAQKHKTAEQKEQHSNAAPHPETDLRSNAAIHRRLVCRAFLFHCVWGLTWLVSVRIFNKAVCWCGCEVLLRYKCRYGTHIRARTWKWIRSA